MKVIGTAGHIDHGKSTLVRRLTGIDPDRLEEEKQRGMTIDLGFAWLTLPSGAEASIVDVPGHERFIKNMLAGAGGVDVALLVVAADEGVMPQTREHLDILDLLEVRTAVVALSKSDLVDAEWLEMVTNDVETLLHITTLRGSPLIPVSAVTGRGLETLLGALDSALAQDPAQVERDMAFLPIDRVFTLSGFGTVVTGTLHGAPLHSGEEVEFTPSGRRARIRGLQVHRSMVEEAPPAARVAVNVSGVSREQVSRGDVLALPGRVRATRRFDAKVRVVGDAPCALRHGTEVMVHVGAAECAGTVSLLGSEAVEPGREGWAQIRLHASMAVIPGQRFILRLPAPVRTIAGGQVIDPAPRHRRSDPHAVRRLADLSAGSPQDVVLASLVGTRSRDLAQISAATGRHLEDVRDAMGGLLTSGRVVALGDGYVSSEMWKEIERSAILALEHYHAANPLRQGMSLEQLRSTLRRPAEEWPYVARRLVAGGIVRQTSGTIALVRHHAGVETRRSDADRVLALLRSRPYAPPSGLELRETAGVERAFLEAMCDAGEVVRVAEGLYFDRAAYDDLVSTIVKMICANGELTVATARDALGTSRKYVLALLEHLDAERVTRRVGDARVLGNRAPACA